MSGRQRLKENMEHILFSLRKKAITFLWQAMKK